MSYLMYVGLYLLIGVITGVFILSSSDSACEQPAVGAAVFSLFIWPVVLLIALMFFIYFMLLKLRVRRG